MPRYAAWWTRSCSPALTNAHQDLSQLGRPISDTIIIDNPPAPYIFHPNNTVAVSSRFNALHDTELTGLHRFLTDLAQVDDVRGVRWRPIIRTVMKLRMAGDRITLAGCICTGFVFISMHSCRLCHSS